ncbi:hypothetical protein C5E45_20430 [Nocardia nova]|uniref:Uncharacterized protein n=1 Tax=Nocardia nova TaxID=37330 RepID=A0A2S6AME6_9NOCA|nr:hypothetical protein [Nocardia nova]PPJ36417.1 hypothetical protein C5E45_20430 [Nocardia nova]
MSMTKLLSYMPSAERDRLAVGDCTTPPDPEITTAQAHLLRSQHAGHPATCVLRLARSREEGDPRIQTTCTPSSSAVDATAAVEPVPAPLQAWTA